MPTYRVELDVRVIDVDVERLEADVYERPGGLLVEGSLALGAEADTPREAIDAALTVARDLLLE